MRTVRGVALAATLCALAATVACGAGTEQGGAPSPGGTTGSAPAGTSTSTPGGSATSGPPAPAATTSAWSSGPVSVEHDVAVPPVPVLTGIRSAAHPAEGFDRIVFDIDAALPSYQVRYVATVVRDGSGQPVTMPGRRYLQITMRPLQAHTEAGVATVPTTVVTLDYPMLRGYAVVGDFEGVVTVALGLDDVVGFRVGELAGRIYVDVAA